MSNPERSCADLERIADLVREDAPSLATVWLTPDGKFLTRSVGVDAINRELIDCLARHLRQRAAEELPVLYAAWGKARVGSTALTNLFGIAGLPAYYQPVKAMARRAVTGADPQPWVPPLSAVHPRIFAKETAGPYSLFECLFIPLQLLIEAGYPPDKLHLIALDRKPAVSFASWLAKWSHRVSPETLLRHHVIAALNGRRVESYARRQGIPVTHYVYEASREPVRAAKALFDRLGLGDRLTDAMVTDWQEMGELDSENARVIYPEEPAVYSVPGLHGSDTGYRYHERRVSALTDAQLAFLAQSGVDAVYGESIRACVSDLGFDAATAARLFGLDIDRIGVAA